MTTETAPETKTPRRSDFAGEVYGEWTVVGKGEQLEKGKRFWLVRHSSGAEKTVPQTALKALAKDAPDATVGTCETYDVHGLLAAGHDPFELPAAALNDLAEVEEGDDRWAPGWAEKAVALMGPVKEAPVTIPLGGPNPWRHPGTVHEVGALRSEDATDPFGSQDSADTNLDEDYAPELVKFCLDSFASGPMVPIQFDALAEPAPLVALDGDQPDPLRRAIKDLYEAVETAKLAIQACQSATDHVLKYAIKAG